MTERASYDSLDAWLAVASDDEIAEMFCVVLTEEQLEDLIAALDLRLAESSLH